MEKLQSVALSNLEYEEFFGKIKEIPLCVLWKTLSSNMLRSTCTNIFLLSHIITVVHKVYICRLHMFVWWVAKGGLGPRTLPEDFSRRSCDRFLTAV